MSYQVIDMLLPIGMNRSGDKLNPVGFVVHSTSDVGATVDNEYRYFSSGNRNASAHYFADYTKIGRFIPENEIAWSCGQTGNGKYISVEMCEFNDPNQFKVVWDKTVWLIADACNRYGWNPDTDVVSHNWVSQKWHESTHDDPFPYFAVHGVTWQQFVDAVKASLNSMKKSPQPSNFYRVFADNKQQGAFSVKANAYKLGWDLFNTGKLDAYLTDPSGSLYTFGKHPDENPNPPQTPKLSPVVSSTTTLPIEPVKQPVEANVLHSIIGISEATADQMIALVKGINPDFDESIAHAFLDVSAKYGVRGDIAFCQSIIETGWFKYEGSQITSDMHNYAGIGVTSQNAKGNWFATVTEGVTAQIQHLFAYASKDALPVGETLKDPRFQFVIRGSATNWEDLNNKWAMNNSYADEILGIYRKLMKVIVEKPTESTIEQPQAPVVQVVQVSQSVTQEDWRVTLGKGALKDLVNAGLIEKPEDLQDKMLDSAENWLILVLLSHLGKKGV